MILPQIYFPISTALVINLEMAWILEGGDFDIGHANVHLSEMFT